MSHAANTPSRHRMLSTMAGRVSACVAVALKHLEQTTIHAKELRDVAVSRDVRDCVDALNRAMRHAEQARQRHLRRADRMEGEADHA